MPHSVKPPLLPLPALACATTLAHAEGTPALTAVAEGPTIFDTAFKPGKIWLWDTVWTSHFGNYPQDANPSVSDLMAGYDLFYRAQGEDGCIPHFWNSPENLTASSNTPFVLAVDTGFTNKEFVAGKGPNQTFVVQN